MTAPAAPAATPPGAPAAAPAAPPAASPGAPEGEVQLTFMDHLRDLRKRLIHALYGVLAGTTVTLFFAKPLYVLLMAPILATLPEAERTIGFRDLVEPVMVYMKVGFYGGLFLAAPWVLLQFWLFVAPGLYKREKKVVVPFLLVGTLLFYAGAAFCYFLVMPAAFPAMMAFATDAFLKPELLMREQLSVVLAMLLGFGVIFEMPVVIAFLSMIGLVSADTLAKHRRVAIIANVALAAFITPTGDPLNLAMMAVPMVLFYEIGVLAARVLGKKAAGPDALART